jgi:hypothetical protein
LSGREAEAGKGLFNVLSIDWQDEQAPPGPPLHRQHVDLLLWAKESMATPLTDHFDHITADEIVGSPACERFPARVPLIGPAIDPVHKMTGEWLQMCEDSHESCEILKDVRLPTRVLSLMGDVDAPLVCLIETAGMRGRYCALSHCWGPPYRRPLRTTSESYQSHLNNIRFRDLPRTFQEAIMLVLGMGMQFLWIDSLCILQDSQEDWQIEAKVMRDVYHNAALVIAASGAADATEGLFVSQRPQLTVQKLPYMVDERPRGSFNAAILPSWGSIWASMGPLGQRAWALQERHLARRVIDFMPGRISWRCKETHYHDMEQRRPGEPHEPHEHHSTSWHTLLDHYTSLKLTYHSDRLDALRGIATQEEQRRQERFDFRFGVWKESLFKDLLWRKAVAIETDVLDLPTWTWAATGGRKIWNPLNFCDELISLASSLAISASGSLAIHGNLTNNRLLLRPYAKDLFSGREGYGFPVSDILWNEGVRWSIWHPGYEDKLMGLAVSDSHAFKSDVRFFFVAHARYGTFSMPP